MLAEATRTGAITVALTSTRAANVATPTRTARSFRREACAPGLCGRAGAVAKLAMLLVAARVLRDRVVGMARGQVDSAILGGDQELPHHVVVLVRQVVAVDHVSAASVGGHTCLTGRPAVRVGLGGHGVVHQDLDGLALADVDDVLGALLPRLHTAGTPAAAEDPEVDEVDVERVVPAAGVVLDPPDLVVARLGRGSRLVGEDVPLGRLDVVPGHSVHHELVRHVVVLEVYVAGSTGQSPGCSHHLLGFASRQRDDGVPSRLSGVHRDAELHHATGVEEVAVVLGAGVAQLYRVADPAVLEVHHDLVALGAGVPPVGDLLRGSQPAIGADYVRRQRRTCSGVDELEVH